MTSLTVTRQQPVFAMPSRIPASILGPTPSTAAGELSVAPATPLAGGLVDKLFRGELELGKQAARDDTTEFVLMCVPFHGMTAGFFASLFANDFLFLGAAAALAATVTPVIWARAWVLRRREIRKVASDFGGAEQAATEVSAVEHVLIRNIAGRTNLLAKEAGPLAKTVQRLAQARNEVSPETIDRVDAVCASVFAGKSLERASLPLENIERLIWALESSPPEERAILARFIAERVGTELLEMELVGADAVRRDMLREALSGGTYKFSKADRSEEGKSDPRFDLSVAAINLALQQTATLAPKECAWGRTYLADLETAKRVAAHFEERGYRVSVGNTHEYGKPPISVVAYGAERDPGAEMHGRPFLAALV
jgi:hypothetical protein